MSGRLIIRADASPAIGVGHVMRCLALAQAWQDAGGRATMAWSEMPGSLLDRLRREGLDLAPVHAPPGSPADAEQTAQVARERNANWVVTDGYHFDPSYHQRLRAVGLKLMALDDMAHLKHYDVDLLLNQNLSATRELYSNKTDVSTKLLLGPRYGLLRREFRACQEWTRPPAHEPLRLMVSFGGSDTGNITGLILQSLSRSQPGKFQVVVLAGAANPHVAELRQLASDSSFPCEIRVAVDNVAEVMAWADVAITAAGSTVWELVSMKLPALVGALAENQIAGLPALQSIPFFRVALVGELVSWNLAAAVASLLSSLQGINLNDPATRNGLDANGASRVVEALARLSPLS